MLREEDCWSGGPGVVTCPDFVPPELLLVLVGTLLVTVAEEEETRKVAGRSRSRLLELLRAGLLPTIEVVGWRAGGLPEPPCPSLGDVEEEEPRPRPNGECRAAGESA